MYVGIAGRCLIHLGKDSPPLLAWRGRSREHQTAVILLLGDVVRLDHTHRILESVEPRSLQQDRFVARDPQPIESSANLALAELPILLGQRIDRWIDEKLRDG